MTIPKNCKVELSASADVKTRKSICEPYLDLETNEAGVPVRGQLIATDGRIMAVVPITPNDHDVSGYVSEEVLKASRNVASGKYVSVVCNGTAQIADNHSMPRAGLAEGTYPNWRQVLPAKVEAAAEAPTTHCIVALDIALLWKLAQSLGTEGLRLQIPVDGMGCIRVDACLCKGQYPTGAYGAIMPMRLS